MKRTRASALVLAGATGLAGLGVGAVIAPGAAMAATTSSTQAVGDRVTAIKSALSGLVKDDTITQAQADKVASTLNDKLPAGGGGPGAGGPGLDAVAKAVGITTDELRTGLQGGKTLAQLAKDNGVDQSTLVDRLVTAAKTQIAAAVTAGRLTQAQADTITSDLQDRITQQVTSTGPVGGPGFGGRGGPGIPAGGCPARHRPARDGWLRGRAPAT